MKDVIIIVADIEEPGERDDFLSYAVTKVFRYDYDGTDKELIDAVEGLPGIIEGSQMKNE